MYNNCIAALRALFGDCEPLSYVLLGFRYSLFWNQGISTVALYTQQIWALRGCTVPKVKRPPKHKDSPNHDFWNTPKILM